MSKPILHAEFLKAYADGQSVEYKYVDSARCSSWTEISHGNDIGLFDSADLELRIKPKTILINGIEVPEPVREPLEIGQQYFFCDMAHEIFGYACTWTAGSVDIRRLKRGLIQLTHEATQTYARALLSFAAKDE